MENAPQKEIKTDNLKCFRNKLLPLIEDSESFPAAFTGFWMGQRLAAANELSQTEVLNTEKLEIIIGKYFNRYKCAAERRQHEPDGHQTLPEWSKNDRRTGEKQTLYFAETFINGIFTAAWAWKSIRWSIKKRKSTQSASFSCDPEKG